MHVNSDILLRLLLATSVLAIVGCGKSKKPQKTDMPSITKTAEVNLLKDGQSGAAILYRSKLYRMDIKGDCGANADGAYLTWATTQNADGDIDGEAPTMLINREGNWSIIDFYEPQSKKIVRVYREGAERLSFDNGVLKFSGELNPSQGDYVEIDIKCP